MPEPSKPHLFAVSKPFIPTKLHWAVVASLALVIPVFILRFRLRIMCPVLGLKAFDFLPLVWVGSGCVPHPFCRVMHNLTHPVFLAGYTIATGYLAIRPMRKPMTERFSVLLLFGLLSFHLIFLAAYLVTPFLPIRMMEVISHP